jgi:hypothetical protein
MTIPINLAVEDLLSELVVKRILAFTGRGYVVGAVYGRGGYGYLKKTLNGWNNAAKSTPYFVLTDLDDNDCAPSLISSWLKHPRHPNLIFRIAVREVESWLLADYENLAHYLHVKPMSFAEDPDSVTDPKDTLLAVARRSKSAEIRSRLLPKGGSTAKQGPDYNGFLGQFVANNWDVETARTQSRSLDRAILRLLEFAPTWPRAEGVDEQ